MSYSLYYSCQDNHEKFENITLNKVGKDLESEKFEELEESLFPIYNYIHLLQERPSDEEIIDIYKNAPNISILYIEEFEKYGFSYYPNPVRSSLILKAKIKIEKVSVFNILGQEVMMTYLNKIEGKIDMTNLQNGVYFVKVLINKSSKTIQIIKH